MRKIELFLNRTGANTCGANTCHPRNQVPINYNPAPYSGGSSSFDYNYKITEVEELFGSKTVGNLTTTRDKRIETTSEGDNHANRFYSLRQGRDNTKLVTQTSTLQITEESNMKFDSDVTKVRRTDGSGGVGTWTNGNLRTVVTPTHRETYRGNDSSSYEKYGTYNPPTSGGGSGSGSGQRIIYVPKSTTSIAPTFGGKEIGGNPVPEHPAWKFQRGQADHITTSTPTLATVNGYQGSENQRANQSSGQPEILRNASQYLLAATSGSGGPPSSTYDPAAPDRPRFEVMPDEHSASRVTVNPSGSSNGPTREFGKRSWNDFWHDAWMSVGGVVQEYPTNVGRTMKGYFYEGPKEGLVAIYTILNDVPGFIQGLEKLATQLQTDPGALFYAIVEDVMEEAETPEGQGKLAFEIVTTLLSGGTVGGLKQGSKLAILLDKVKVVTQVGDKAKDISQKTNKLVSDLKVVSNQVRPGGCLIAGTIVELSAVLIPELVVTDESSPGEIPDHSHRVAMAIEDVPLGSRIGTINPDPGERRLETTPDARSWLLVELEVITENRKIVAEVLRPRYLLDDKKVGDLIALEMVELGGQAVGRIVRLDDCPPLAFGSGEVVTGRFVTRDVDELVRIELPGGVSLTGTPNHPVWSVQDDGWKPLGRVTSSDWLLGEQGPVPVLSATPIYQIADVYNLEVQREHVYTATHLGIVVHNNTLDELCKKLKGIQEKMLEAKTPEQLEELSDELKTLQKQYDELAPKGPLSEADQLRIQRFADKYDTDVHVVGSRAKGTARPDSDYDYILGDTGGNSRLRQKARQELPCGTAGGEIHPSRGETGIDVFKELLDPNRPHITIRPNQPESQ